MTDNGRKFIAGMQMTLDGFTEARDGTEDWADSWSTAIGLIGEVDLFVLGGGMFPDYAEFWTSIREQPEAIPPGETRPPNAAEIAYAEKAAATRHVVLSTTLDAVGWPSAEIVRDLDALRAIKAEPGGTTYVVGGAGLIGALMNAGMLDELVLHLHPLVLTGRKPLFGGVIDRQKLDLIDARIAGKGRVVLRYRVLGVPASA